MVDSSSASSPDHSQPQAEIGWRSFVDRQLLPPDETCAVRATDADGFEVAMLVHTLETATSHPESPMRFLSNAAIELKSAVHGQKATTVSRAGRTFRFYYHTLSAPHGDNAHLQVVAVVINPEQKLALALPTTPFI